MKMAAEAERDQRHSRRRIPVLILIFLALTTMIGPPAVPPLRARSDAVLIAEAVPLDGSRPERQRVGRLEYLGGWSLRSGQRGFGGISAMHVADGQVIAVNDAAIAFAWPLPARPGKVRLSLRPLSAGGAKMSRDSEAMTVAGGRVWIAYERMNRIARYRLPGWRLEAAARPPAMAGWSENSGAEAMLRLEDGRFVIFGEDLSDSDRTSPLLVFATDPAVPGARAAPRRFRPPADYRVTDAAALPGGDLLVLVRRFDLGRGVAAKLVRVARARLDRSLVEGEEIADLRPPITVDNMEALSVEVSGGQTIVRIGSDDNFVDFQRSLLLEFRLIDGMAKSPPTRAGGD